jgi:hypothetical protein
LHIDVAHIGYIFNRRDRRTQARHQRNGETWIEGLKLGGEFADDEDED